MLRIEHLTKRYGTYEAVSDLNLEIAKGEIFGFVGPNGAGKTTTMRIICALLEATSGHVYGDDIDIMEKPEQVKRKVGYVPDFFGVYDNLKVMEYMEFYGSMYGMNQKEIRNVSEGLLELVNLSEKKDAFVDTLSRGMQQRLCVARALIHNPELLVLDEPNSGLDPRARFEMKEVLKNLMSMGKTIFISSHILPELSELCTSIGIMEKGHLKISGRVEEVMQKSRGLQPIHMRVLFSQADQQAHMQLEQMLREEPQIGKVSFTEDEILFGFAGDEQQAAKLLKRLIDRGVCVTQYYREKEDLESLFLQITGNGGGSEEA